MTTYETLWALLHARHSCRAFRPHPVPRETVEKILRAAQRVPSWCNAQPWQVVVTSGAATERLREGMMAEAANAPETPDFAFPRAYEGIYRDRRRTCGWQLYESVGVTRGDREGGQRQMAENFRFFGAPHVAVVTSPESLGPYGAIDCGGYVTAFTLAAEALGVASIPQAAVAPFAPFLRQHLGLPGDRLVVCAISFGFEDTAHPANAFRTERADLTEAVEFRE